MLEKIQDNPKVELIVPLPDEAWFRRIMVSLNNAETVSTHPDRIKALNTLYGVSYALAHHRLTDDSLPEDERIKPESIRIDAQKLVDFGALQGGSTLRQVEIRRKSRSSREEQEQPAWVGLDINIISPDKLYSLCQDLNISPEVYSSIVTGGAPLLKFLYTHTKANMRLPHIENTIREIYVLTPGKAYPHPEIFLLGNTEEVHGHFLYDQKGFKSWVRVGMESPGFEKFIQKHRKHVPVPDPIPQDCRVSNINLRILFAAATFSQNPAWAEKFTSSSATWSPNLYDYDYVPLPISKSEERAG